MAQPASILTHQRRQRQRLTDAVAHAWNHDHGRHRPDLEQLLRLVDTGNMPVAEALDIVRGLQRQAQHAA